jgi:hypothetical protein
MRIHRSASVIACLFLLSAGVPAARADEGNVLEGSGYGAYDTPSIKGFDEGKINKDPVCDRSRRPKITTVEPDEAKPGDKLVIKGENFGTKECFHGVSFSAASGVPVNFKYVNETTVEATVPNTRSGMSFVIVVAGGGSAQKPVLIKGK